ncbi:hypothetical protein [Streptomyces sp. NPDC047928]|uniref:hypothetical protein n=1 Tax=unclassified Streptomyces TaxID=2593676 RepID=UPI003711A6F0
MRASLARRSAVAASAVSLALLVTACGSEKTTGGDEGAKGDKGAVADAGSAKALTAAELEKAIIAQGDVDGYKVQQPGAADRVPAEQVTVDKAACQPLAHAVYAVALGEPKATVGRKVVQEPKKGDKPSLGDLSEKELEDAVASAFDLTSTMVSLASYEGKGADEAVASLRKAAGECAGGFTLKLAGEAQKVLKVEELKVSGGQEAAGWTVLTQQEGGTMPLKVAVVRQGSTLASFSVVNFGAAGSGKDYDLPTAVIDAQVGKLG